jgi:hypothetical protein
MGLMNIPEKVYHRYYDEVDRSNPNLSDDTKWSEARKNMIKVLEDHFK